jgi:putative oxidoreductase
LIPTSLTGLRLGVGIIMVVHGWSKLTDVAGWQANLVGMGIPLPEIAGWLTIAGELLGGAGLLVGLLTPLAAFGVLCVMVGAIFLVHLENGLLASNNGFEYPLTLALVAAYFMIRGAGPVSLDAVLFKTRAARHGAPLDQPDRSDRERHDLRTAPATG